HTVQGPSAVVALIAASALVATVGARALDETVRKVASVIGTIERLHRIQRNVPVVQHPQKQLVDNLTVVRGARTGEEVEADAESAPGLQELGVVVVGQLLG